MFFEEKPKLLELTRADLFLVRGSSGRRAEIVHPGPAGERSLFDSLGFKPAVNLAFAKEDLSLEFEKRNLASLHQKVKGPLAYAKKFHDFGPGHEVFFHFGAY